MCADAKQFSMLKPGLMYGTRNLFESVVPSYLFDVAMPSSSQAALILLRELACYVDSCDRLAQLGPWNLFEVCFDLAHSSGQHGDLLSQRELKAPAFPFKVFYLVQRLFGKGFILPRSLASSGYC